MSDTDHWAREEIAKLKRELAALTKLIKKQVDSEYTKHLVSELNSWRIGDGAGCYDAKSIGLCERSEVFLKNRLDSSFIAGADAAQKYFETRKESP